MIGPEDDLTTLIDRHDHLNILRYIRAHKLRESQLVVAHGSKLFEINDNDDDDSESENAVVINTAGGGAKLLGHAERLAALEQLCIASLDVGDIRLAEGCLAAITTAGAGGAKSAPLVTKSSTRYRKLVGLYLEATGDYDNASALYQQLITENPSNSHAAKRQYCILAAQPKKQVEAMASLNEYLNNHPGDAAAWYQMYQVRLSVCDYEEAAYCLEEVILACPLDSKVHTLCGEAYATAGGLTNTKLARKHLALAIQLNAKNVRAWFGLLSASESYLEEVQNLTTTSSGGGGKNGKRVAEEEEESIEVAKELIKLAGEKLMQVYNGKKMLGIVESILKETSESL